MSGQNSWMQYLSDSFFSEERGDLKPFCLTFIQVSALFRVLKCYKPFYSCKPHTTIFQSHVSFAPYSFLWFFFILFYFRFSRNEQFWEEIKLQTFIFYLGALSLNQKQMNRACCMFWKHLYHDIAMCFCSWEKVGILQLFVHLYCLRASVQNSLMIMPDGHGYLNYFIGFTYN